MQLIAIFHEEAEETFWETQRFGRIASFLDKLTSLASGRSLENSAAREPPCLKDQNTAQQHSTTEATASYLSFGSGPSKTEK